MYVGGVGGIPGARQGGQPLRILHNTVRMSCVLVYAAVEVGN